MANEPEETPQNSYELLKLDPEAVDVLTLSILAKDDWELDRDLHVKMLSMLLDEAEDTLMKIEAATQGELSDLERIVHYFKGSADVVRADRLATVCNLVLKFLRSGSDAEALERIPLIRVSYRELEAELKKTRYLDGK